MALSIQIKLKKDILFGTSICCFSINMSRKAPACSKNSWMLKREGNGMFTSFALQA